MRWRAPMVPTVVTALTFMFVPSSVGSDLVDRPSVADGQAVTDGRQIWLSDKASAYPAPKQLWKFGAPPDGISEEPFPSAAIRAGRVVAEVMTDDITSTMRVWDAKTGKQIKQLARNLMLGDRAIYGGSYFDGAGPANVLDAYDLTTGKLKWTKKDEPFSPILEERGVLYVSDYLSGTDNSASYRSITAADGKSRWTSGRYVSKATYFEPSVVGDGLYLSDECGSVIKLSTTTGKKVWSRSFTCREDPYAYQVAAVGYGRKLYIQVKEGDHRVLDTATGKVLATQHWDTIPVVDGELGYFVKDKVLSKVNLRTGKTLWQLHVTGGVSGVVAPTGGRVVIWSNTGKAYLLESLTGKVRWATSQPIRGFDGSVALGWENDAITAWS